MLPIDIIFIVYCVYVPFLVLLYVAEVWIILKPGTPFKGAFYMLFVASSVVDLVMVGCTIHEFRLVSFPLTNEIFENYDCQVCVRTRVTLSFICPMTQDLLNCFIALNRLTSFMKPTQADDMWKKLLPFSICFSYLFSIVISTARGFRNITFTKIGQAFLMAIDDTYLPWYNAHLITEIEMAITSALMIFFYAMSALSFRKLVGSSKMKNKERMLLKIGILTFVMAIPGMILQALFSFRSFPRAWISAIFNCFGFIIDSKCFAPAISMIVVNKPFREQLLSSFGISRCTTTKVSDGQAASVGGAMTATTVSSR